MNGFFRILARIGGAFFVLFGIIMIIPYFISAMLATIWFFQTGITSKALGRVLALVPITICLVATLSLDTQNTTLIRSWWWPMLIAAMIASGMVDGWYVGKAHPTSFLTSPTLAMYGAFILAALGVAASGSERQIFVGYGMIIVSVAMILNGWSPESKLRMRSDSEAVGMNFSLNFQRANRVEYWTSCWVVMIFAFLTIRHLTITVEMLSSLGGESANTFIEEIVVFLAIICLFMMLIRNDGGSKRKVLDLVKALARGLAKLAGQLSPSPT